MLVSLLSPTAFTFAADLIGEYEGGGQGLHWGDLWVDPYPLGAVLIMLALDAKLYAFLAWCALADARSLAVHAAAVGAACPCTIEFGMHVLMPAVNIAIVGPTRGGSAGKATME